MQRYSYFRIANLFLNKILLVNATRPVLVLTGAVLLFGERLNGYQWAGVSVSILSLFLLSLSGRKEGIDFKRDKWIFILFGAVVMVAVSGLYDKFIMKQLLPLFVQSWFNIYQVAKAFDLILILIGLLLLCWGSII